MNQFLTRIPYEFILRRLATILSVAIVTLTLLAAVTGILLSFYYAPTAGGAYRSLQFIDTQVQSGWLIHRLHNIAGNTVIVIALMQIVVMFLSRRFRTSWLTAWISGILFTLSAIGLSWTAMILSWDQLGYWRFRIELQTIEAIPVIGSQLRDILTGGAINTETVEHLYTLHSYIISVTAVILAVIHLWSLLQQEKEQNQPKVTVPSAGELPDEPTREAELVQMH